MNKLGRNQRNKLDGTLKGRYGSALSRVFKTNTKHKGEYNEICLTLECLRLIEDNLDGMRDLISLAIFMKEQQKRLERLYEENNE